MTHPPDFPSSPRFRSRSDLDRSIGRHIRRLRQEQRRTQQQIADAIGISCQQVQKYETAKNRVSASTLFVLAQVFRVSVLEFYDDA